MEKTLIHSKNKSGHKKHDRELLVTISMFLLNQEEMRKLVWSVKSATYHKPDQVVKIGINTTSGKLGTTLARLRKTSRNLSDYLYEHGLTFRKAEIQFFVEKEDVQLERIYNLISQVK